MATASRQDQGRPPRGFLLIWECSSGEKPTDCPGMAMPGRNTKWQIAIGIRTVNVRAHVHKCINHLDVASHRGHLKESGPLVWP